MQIKLISQEKDFLLLGAQWNTLLEESGIDNIFLNWEWMSTWWKNFATERDELFLLCGYEGERLVGIAPFFITRGIFKKIAFLGTGAVCPEYLTFIWAPGYQQRFTEQVVESLEKDVRVWDILVLEGVLAGEKFSDSFREAVSRRGWCYRVQSEEACYYLPLQGGSQGIYSIKSKTLVRDLQKKENRLKEYGEVSWRMYDGAHTKEGFDVLVKLHTRRWQSQVKNGGIFSNKAVLRFFTDINSILQDKRMVNINILYCGKQPIAANYNFIFHKKVYHYCTGYDSAYRWYSPGSMSLLKCVDDYAQRGFRELDFLRGDEAYKSRWTARQRTQQTVVIIPAKIKSRFWWGCAQPAYFIKSWLKRVLPNRVNLFLHAVRYNRQR